MNIKQISKFTIGTLIITLGVTLLLLSNFGSGAIDAFNNNTSILVGITVGTCIIITNAIMFVMNMILDTKKSHFISLLLALLLGIFIDFWFTVIPVYESFMMATIYFIIGLMLLPLGLALTIRSNCPINPYDTLVLILVRKTNLSVSVIKTITEITFTILAIISGYLAGIGFGSISFGTILIAFYIGPALQFSLKYIK
ncbi:hypothetical protein RJG79_11285 [Mycoplasmatota bacterium WC44]